MKNISLILFIIINLLYSDSLVNIQNLYDRNDFINAKVILEDNSFDSSEYFYLGYQIYLKLDDLNKSNEFLQKAIEINPDSEEYSDAADFLSELINDLKNTNKTLTSGYIDEAIAEINKLTSKYSSNAIVYYRLGYAYKTNDDYDNAVIYFRKAVELNPYEESYRQEITNLANMEILKGKDFYSRKEYMEALQHFNKALEYDPENSSAMFRLGNIYFAIKDYLKASEYLEKGLLYQGNNYKVLYMLGRCYSALSDTDKALEAYDKALSFNPMYTKAIFEKSKIYKSMGDIDRTKSLLSDLIDLDSKFSKAYELLVDIEIQSKNYLEAQKIGEKALIANPKSYSLLARMASLYNELNNYDKAKTSAKESLKIKRKYAPALFELGVAELNTCNKLAAKEAFNGAKRDRNYRKAASDYLKPENFEYYTKDCN